MPVEQTTTLNIVCDNPACPGNTLDPADRTGWFFITSEIYGMATQSHVFCSNTCAATAATDDQHDFANPTPITIPTPEPITPTTP